MKFFISLILLFFLLRLLLPYLIRWALQAFVKRTIRKGGFPNAFGPTPFGRDSFRPRQSPPAAGNVTIDYGPDEPSAKGKPNGPDFKGGEYVDYEEVK